MTIVTKYDYDDKVITLYKGKVVQATIKSVYTRKEVGDKTSKISYIVRLDEKTTGFQEDYQSLNEDVLFSTKEELMASL